MTGLEIVLAVAVLVVGLIAGKLGANGAKFKKYAGYLISAVEIANNKKVKATVKELVEKHESINDVDFNGFVSGIVAKVQEAGISTVIDFIKARL